MAQAMRVVNFAVDVRPFKARFGNLVLIFLLPRCYSRKLPFAYVGNHRAAADISIGSGEQCVD
jgi:hypothetical protein